MRPSPARPEDAITPSPTTRRLSAWLLPEGAILAAAILVATADTLFDPVLRFAPVGAAVIFALGLLLGARFDRGRLVLAILALVACERALALWSSGTAPEARALFQSIAVALPLLLATLAWMLERGALSPAGWRRLAGLVALAGFLAVLARSSARELLPYLEARWLPPHLTRWTPVGDLGLVAFAAAALTIGVGLAFDASAERRPWLWSLAAVFLGLQPARPDPATTVFCAAAALMLVVATIDVSYRMAYHDGLTGLPSRRALTEALARLEAPWTAAMVDVDHFKRLNDTYGHETGDQVLRMVAAHLAGARGGTAYRYGGEEFALLFPGLEPAAVLPEVERLREAVAATGFATRRRLRPRKKPAQPRRRSSATQLGVTVSVGVAAAAPGASPDDVLRAADRALYRAKEAGRNQVR